MDTLGWTNKGGGKGFACDVYEKKWCAYGKAKPGKEWALGKKWNYPEKN